MDDKTTVAVERRIRNELTPKVGRSVSVSQSGNHASTDSISDTSASSYPKSDSSLCGSDNVAKQDASAQTNVAKLTELDGKIQALNARIASSNSASDATLEMYAQADELQRQYDALSASITKQGVLSTPQSVTSTVYKKYCLSPSVVSVRQPPVSADPLNLLPLNISKTDFRTLACNLEKRTYEGSQIPSALYYMGFKLMQAGQFDDGFSFYSCDAQKYYHLTSMYRVAQVYRYGSTEFQKIVPGTVVQTPMQPDLRKAYYWIVALVHTESVQKTGILDTGTSLGWNIIGMLDALQQNQSLPDNDLLNTEREAVVFVGKKYPEVLNDQASVYKHSMRAIIPALQNAATQ